MLRARAVLDLVVEIAGLAPEGSRAAFERECYEIHPSLLAAVERAARDERVLDPAELHRVAGFFARLSTAGLSLDAVLRCIPVAAGRLCPAPPPARSPPVTAPRETTRPHASSAPLLWASSWPWWPSRSGSPAQERVQRACGARRPKRAQPGRWHLARLMRRWRVTNRAALVTVGFQRGVLGDAPHHDGPERAGPPTGWDLTTVGSACGLLRRPVVEA